MMKKLFSLGVVSVLSILSLGSVTGYDIQPGDNALLDDIYDRIDQVYTTDHTRLIDYLDMTFVLDLRYSNDPQSAYFLTKINEYVAGKLRSFVESPEYICLQDRVQYGDSVSIDYDLYTMQGQRIHLIQGPTDEETDPLLFNAGKGQVIKGIDTGVYGTQQGESYDVYLTPTQAWGVSQDSLITSLSTPQLLALAPDAQAGDQVVIVAVVQGRHVQVSGTIVAIGAESAVLDLNHPLAGESIVGEYTVQSFFKSCR